MMLVTICVMISSQSSRLARPAFHILQRSGCSSLGSVGGWCGSRVFSEFSDSRSFSSRSGRTERRTERMWNNAQQLSGRNNAGRPSVCLSTSRPMSTRAKRDFYQVLGVSKSADKVSTALGAALGAALGVRQYIVCCTVCSLAITTGGYQEGVL